MKSKTSSFNMTIFRKNLTHYWPIWVVYLCYLIMVVPVSIGLIYANVENNYIGNMPFEHKQYYVVGSMLSGAGSVIPVFVAAAVAALAVFSYLYNPRNANMIHSLPVDRRELYITNYVSGFVFLFVPELIAFIAGVLVCLANQINCIQYVFYWFIDIAGISFFAYSLAVFVAMLTGNIFAMPFYYLAVNYLWIGGTKMIQNISSLICYGVSDTWSYNPSSILSPLDYLFRNLSMGIEYDKDYVQAVGVTISGGKIVAAYAVAAVVITVLAYVLYKRHKVETAGDVVSISILKPVFRWLSGICGGGLIALAVSALLLEYIKMNEFICLFILMLVFGSICFLAAEMVLQKSFRVLCKKRIMEWIGFAAAVLILLGCFRIDVFGIERHIPDASEIEAAFVNMDYPIYISKEQIPEILKLQQQCVDSKDEYLSVYKKEKNYYYTTFRYYMKDGSMFERRYPVSVTDTALKDKKSVAYKLAALEADQDNLMKQVLGDGYKENDYYSGYLTVYNGRGESDVYTFSRDESNILKEAIEQDVKEGNFDAYQLSAVYKDEQESIYTNALSLSYYGKGNGYQTWDYYYNYMDYRNMKNNNVMVGDASGSCYIQVGPKCVNTIRVLKKMGVINDTWHLYNYNELEEIQKNTGVAE